MFRSKSGHTFPAFVATVAAVFAVSAIGSAHAQERKSIRWATSNVGSYCYKVAAAMAKVLEDALGAAMNDSMGYAYHVCTSLETVGLKSLNGASLS